MTKSKNLTPDDYLDRAVNAYKSNNLEEAIEYCNKAIDMDPQNANAYYIRGLAKFEKDKYRDHGGEHYIGAIADFDIAIKINPKHENAYYSRGSAKFLKRNDDGAIADFDKLIQINPKHESAYYHRGFLKRGKGDNSGAIADFDKLIQINPQHEDAYCLRGFVKSRVGDYDGEIADYDKVIQINPQHEAAHYFRGTAKEKKGALNEAIADYDKVIQINPKHTKAHQRRNIVKSRLEDDKKTEKDYRKTKDIGSDAGLIETDAQRPVLNILLFQRDVYLLLAMMLADEAISNVAEFQYIVTENYENEVNRLLLLTAVSARQLMDSMENDDINDISERVCGDKSTTQKEDTELKFRDACNSIIHADRIIPYDDTGQKTSEGEVSSRECYKGTITIHWEDKKNQKKKTVAKLNGQEYAKYCIILSEKF